MGASSLGRLTRWPAAAQFDVKAIFMGLPATTGSPEGRPSTNKGYRLYAVTVTASHVVVIEIPTVAFRESFDITLCGTPVAFLRKKASREPSIQGA